MHELLCDGVRALWHLTVRSMLNVYAELLYQVRAAQDRRDGALRWSGADDELLWAYTEQQ